MDDPILFNPANRLLGGATGEFSLYGGQSNPDFSIHKARGDAPSAQDAGPQGMLDAGAAAVSGADLGISAAPGEGEGASPVGSGTAPSAFLITPFHIVLDPVALAPAPSGAGSEAHDWNPASQGAGSTIPAFENSGAPDATQIDTSSVPTALDGLDIMPQGVVTGTATALLDDLAGAVPGIDTSVIAPIADTAGAVLQTTVAAADDTLDGLAGSDPLGGVATLVSLVSVSDMFDLNPVDAPIVDAAGDPGLGVLDVLAGEELVSPDTLLGTHQDDGLLGTHQDDGLLGGPLDHPLGL